MKLNFQAWCLSLEYSISGAAVAASWGSKVLNLCSDNVVTYMSPQMGDPLYTVNIFAGEYTFAWLHVLWNASPSTQLFVFFVIWLICGVLTWPYLWSYSRTAAASMCATPLVGCRDRQIHSELYHSGQGAPRPVPHHWRADLLQSSQYVWRLRTIRSVRHHDWCNILLLRLCRLWWGIFNVLL